MDPSDLHRPDTSSSIEDQPFTMQADEAYSTITGGQSPKYTEDEPKIRFEEDELPSLDHIRPGQDGKLHCTWQGCHEARDAKSFLMYD
jgi:hypothetical protein